MQNKLKLNQKYYSNNNTQIYYIKNCYESKILEYLQPHLRANSFISFKIVDDLLIKLKKVYSNFYCQKYIIKKFRKLKISLKFFNVFYSKFIKLAAELKFTKEILLQEFMHKLSFCMQDQINFRLKYLDNIKDLILHCQKIYNQILAIDQI